MYNIPFQFTGCYVVVNNSVVDFTIQKIGKPDCLDNIDINRTVTNSGYFW